jgi:hypothetical protein
MNKIIYKRSLILRIIKVCLNIAHRILPIKIYNFLYNVFRRLLWLMQRFYIKAKLAIATFFNKKEFGKLRLVDRLLPYTMGGHLALESTFDIVTKIEEMGIEGDLVECGVARGGCGAIMAMVSKRFGSKRTLWLFDSYEGLPEPTKKDFKNGKTGEMVGPILKGMLVGTVEQVSDLMLNKCNLSQDDVRFVKGWFHNTLPSTKQFINKIAVLRLDGDWYESTKCCLDNLYDKVVHGGFVIVDDYATCYGCERAVTEFINEQGIFVHLFPDGRGGAWFQKL